MRGFTSLPTETVTLTRGSESVDLVVHPYPAGFLAWLMAQMPVPVEFVNGKPVPAEHKRVEHQERIGYVLIAKGLEPSGALDTVFPARANASSLTAYADAIRDEMRAANLTDADVRALAAAVERVTNQQSTGGPEGNG